MYPHDLESGGGHVRCAACIYNELKLVITAVRRGPQNLFYVMPLSSHEPSATAAHDRGS